MWALGKPWETGGRKAMGLPLPRPAAVRIARLHTTYVPLPPPFGAIAGEAAWPASWPGLFWSMRRAQLESRQTDVRQTKDLKTRRGKGDSSHSEEDFTA